MLTRLLALLTLVPGPVAVRADAPLFGREVVPIFYKLGCSAGACHGSFSGKGGFRLSLFASDPSADYREVRGLFGRRINSQSPDDSLLLLKPSGKLPHGGGLRLKPEGDEYRLLRDWIAGGAQFDAAAEGRVVALRVEPPTFVNTVDAPPTELRVLARIEDGRELDITRLSRFEAFDATIAEVDDAGRVRARRAGDTHILAHYAGQVGYTIALVAQSLPEGMRFPEEQYGDTVDRLIVDKLRRLNVVPSAGSM
jgi:hypothetical protein